MLKIMLWFEKLKANFLFWKDRNKEVFRCSECGKEITRDKIGSVIYEFGGQLKYVCNDCTKLHNKLMQERDEFFQQGCPLHKQCALYCDFCSNNKNCAFLEEYNSYLRKKGLD